MKFDLLDATDETNVKVITDQLEQEGKQTAFLHRMDTMMIRHGWNGCERQPDGTWLWMGAIGVTVDENDLRRMLKDLFADVKPAESQPLGEIPFANFLSVYKYGRKYNVETVASTTDLTEPEFVRFLHQLTI